MSVIVAHIAEERTFDGRVLPKTYTPAPGHAVSMDDLKGWIESHRDELLVAAMEHGAVLLRGFPVDAPESFASAIGSFHLHNMPYVGGAAVRSNVVGDVVFTANESPPSEPIPFHHELAQTPCPPTHLFFYCQVAPTSGGETPLVLSHLAYDFMRREFPEFAQKVEALGVTYRRVLPDQDDPTSAIGRSWRSTYLTQSKEEAEKKMSNMGMTWKWLSNGDVVTVSGVLPAVKDDIRFNPPRRMFFNQVVAAFEGWVDVRNNPTEAITFGNGEPMDASVLSRISAFMKEQRVCVKWQPTDIILVDNTVALHSRNPFEPPRRILVSIARGVKPLPHQPGPVPFASVGSDKMPVIGYGCWKVPRGACSQAVFDAIRAGYRHIDGACDYGNEKEVGEGIRRAIQAGLCTRSDLWVTSKLWNTYHAREHVLPAIQRTLSDMGLEYLDLYLIHFPISLQYVPMEAKYPPEWIPPGSDRMVLSHVSLSETWAAMEEIKRQGLAKHIGLSNYNVVLIRDVLNSCTIRPEVLQVELHPFLTQPRLLKFCRAEGIAVVGYSPLGAGSYVELGGARPEDSVLTHPIVQAIGKQYGKSEAQVVLRWGVQRGTSVIPKSSNPNRMAENFAIFDFILCPADMAAIDGLNCGKRYNDPGVFCEAAFGCFCPIYD